MTWDAFRLALELGNDAMREPEHVADALEQVAERLREGATSGRVRDENGNTVGRWELS